MARGKFTYIELLSMSIAQEWFPKKVLKENLKKGIL